MENLERLIKFSYVFFGIVVALALISFNLSWDWVLSDGSVHRPISPYNQLISITLAAYQLIVMCQLLFMIVIITALSEIKTEESCLILIIRCTIFPIGAALVSVISLSVGLYLYTPELNNLSKFFLIVEQGIIFLVPLLALLSLIAELIGKVISDTGNCFLFLSKKIKDRNSHDKEPLQ